jgi:hypothetical protein
MTDDPRFGHAVAERFQRVRHYATTYRPRQQQGYVIHNPFFSPLTTLDKQAMADTTAFLLANGTFTFHSHPQTGLVRTSDTVQTHMHRQWLTDSVMVGYWQRRGDPAGWQRSMATQAAIMAGNQVANVVHTVENNPNWYRQGPVSHGLFHLYQPGCLQLDADGWVVPDSVQEDATWSNRKRLESQAQVLFWLAQTWLANDQPWGFGDVFRHGTPLRHIQAAVSHLTRYLLAVTTDPHTGLPNFQSPSASSWEEAPFSDGMTSDAAFIVLALQAVLAVQSTLTIPNLPALDVLHRTVTAGQAYIHQRIVDPLLAGQAPMQSQSRPADMSLALLAASAYRFFPNDSLKDVRIRLGLVQYGLDQLAGPYGMRRFNEYTLQDVTLHDNYLNYAGNFPRTLYAHLLGETVDASHYFAAGDDTSSPQALLSRQQTSRFAYSAQWGLGLSASLQALVQCLHDIAHVSTELKPVIEATLVDVFNRCIAVIPAPMPDHLSDSHEMLRADGSVCPAYAAMEAYQVVPDADGNPVWLPGAHTLPWHAAQLYDGLIRLQSV